MKVTQCAILVGGAGTRLGDLTRDTPKPMLPVAGRPFLEHLIEKAAGHGFDRVLLLAGHQAQVVETWIAEAGIAGRYGVEIAVSLETTPLGTGGALIHARDMLDDVFLLVNGDTWFDFDWRALADNDAYPAMLALRQIAVADRYETVELDRARVVRFVPRSGRTEPGLINGGVYRLTRDIVPNTEEVVSLEARLLVDLCAGGKLGGIKVDGTFIDIGVPESYAASQTLLAR